MRFADSETEFDEPKGARAVYEPSPYASPYAPFYAPSYAPPPAYQPNYDGSCPAPASYGSYGMFEHFKCIN